MTVKIGDTRMKILTIMLFVGMVSLTVQLIPMAAAQTVPLGITMTKGCVTPLQAGDTYDCEGFATYAPLQTAIFEIFTVVDCINGAAGQVPAGTTTLTCTTFPGDTPIATHTLGATFTLNVVAGTNAKCTGVGNDQLPCVIGKAGDSGTFGGLTLPGAGTDGSIRFHDFTSVIPTPPTIITGGTSVNFLSDEMMVTWKASTQASSLFNKASAPGDAKIIQDFTADTQSSVTGPVDAPVNAPSDDVNINGIDGISGTFDLSAASLQGPGGPYAATCVDDPISSVGPGHTYAITSTCSIPDNLTTPGQYCWNVTVTETGGNYNSDPVELLGSQDSEDECFTIKAPETTRTIGYWQTHLAQFKNYWPETPGDPGTINCSGFDVGTDAQALGGMYAGIPKNTDNTKRSDLDQARMRLAQQLVGAILNNLAFGSIPGGSISIDDAKAAFCSHNIGDINAAQAAMGSFNQSGDAIPFPPGFVNSNATPQAAKAFADKPFWNFLSTKIA